MRLAITGGEGYIGSTLRRLLPNATSFDITTKQDITDTRQQKYIAESSDCIIHLAALSGLKACDDDPIYAHKLNTEATISLAELAKDRSVRRFIFPSSSAVYGEATNLHMDESHPTDPRSLYGQTKLEAERIIRLADELFEVIILRKSNIYGYGTKFKGITVIDKFIESYLTKQPITIIGTGRQKRNFLHIIDACRLYAQIAQAKRVRSGIYNVGGSESISIRELANLVNDIGESVYAYRVPETYLPARNEALFHEFNYDYTLARMEFQFTPTFTIDYYIRERMLMGLR